MKEHYSSRRILRCLLDTVTKSVDFSNKTVNLDTITGRYLAYYSILLNRLHLSKCGDHRIIDQTISKEFGLMLYDAKLLRLYRNNLAHLFDDWDLRYIVKFNHYYSDGILTDSSILRVLEEALNNERNKLGK